MTRKKKPKSNSKVKKLDVSQSIAQRLRKDFEIPEVQVEIIQLILSGYMPTEDAEFVTQVFAPRLVREEENPALPSVTIDMEDGTFQTLTLTDHPLNRTYDYLVNKYGDPFGVLYWAALTSVGKPEDFLSVLRLHETKQSTL